LKEVHPFQGISLFEVVGKREGIQTDIRPEHSALGNAEEV
jgi:hypothetical protein